jgi:hypothetical protein
MSAFQAVACLFSKTNVDKSLEKERGMKMLPFGYAELRFRQ